MAAFEDITNSRKAANAGRTQGATPPGSGNYGGPGGMGNAAQQAYQQGQQAAESAPPTIPPAAGWNGFPLQGFRLPGSQGSGNTGTITQGPFTPPSGATPFQGPFDLQRMFEQSPILKLLLQRYMWADEEEDTQTANPFSGGGAMGNMANRSRGY